MFSAASTAGTNNGDIGAGQIDLACLERIPLQRNERVVRCVVGDLDFLRHGISARDRRVAGAERGAIHTLTARPAVETLAGKPVVAITCLAGCAIGVVVAGGAGDIGTGE
ncbi:hypothetical protein BOTNAR_0105g00050 [Botryotinia narcissicola]|uniref:Uncharacterized protein n=1 Tax=Botryotinia narcissicola TaxID=278944 RepID=A0A4Z1INP1_9HELO|nr:hypothetical protein BOTNAR_0105g00050 [Botryotinia narcissicola]